MKTREQEIAMAQIKLPVLLMGIPLTNTFNKGIKRQPLKYLLKVSGM